ncbi:hypothetical protein GCM10009854_06100 [Saccharopolyspora halophila]|uniref:Uncharacterized protein n=1 Tax=Saccharopolyspora halophila TaxID=405551 RepID=A0ABN3FM93_9PSEU
MAVRGPVPDPDRVSSPMTCGSRLVEGGIDDGLRWDTLNADLVRRPSCELPQGRKAARVSGL